MHDFSFQSSILREDEIRLLNLRWGDAEEELVGNLEVFKITAEKLQRYDTLSYTWGSQEPTEHIKIIQSNQQYCIRIRPNLYQALRHLRFSKNDRYLWVDAICINQEDEKEKSSQVRMMSQIFGNSCCVCVWVGLEEDDSKNAINFVRTRLVHEDADQLLEDSAFRHEWLALSKLMRRPWFSRRWIIQEIAMAKMATLHCGADSLPWEMFAEAVMLFTWGQSKVYAALRTSSDCSASSLGDIRESAAARLIQAQDNIFRKTKDGQLLDKLMSLEDLLCRFSASEALDPRDSIYALLSIARDARAGFSTSGTTREVTPEYPPDPGTAIFYESPSSLAVQAEGHWTPIEETAAVFNNNTIEAASQPATYRKRAASNTSVQDPDGDTRQTKRLLGDFPPFLSTGTAGITNSDESRPVETPTIRISVAAFNSGNQTNGSNTTQVSPTAPNGSELFPKLGETIPVTLGPLITTSSSSQEEIIAPSVVLGGVKHTTFDGSLHSSSQPADDQNMAWLKVPHRVRGNSSASSSSVLTETYLLHTEGIRKKQAREYDILIDYSSPVPEVCKDVMRYAFKKTQSLNMICRPWAPRTGKESSLPSWIQPVTKSAFGPAHNGTYTRINADPLIGKPAPTQCFYNATPNVFARYKIDDDGKNILSVLGFVLDEIDCKAPPANAGVIPVEWNEMAEWEDTTTPPPDNFWRTLVGNRDNLGQQPLKIWRRACRLAFSMKPRDGPLNVEKVLEAQEASSFVREYLEKVLRTTCSRRLSIGTKGLWALTPAKAKKGDKLCIIYGCSVPVVLRQVVANTAATATRSITSSSTSSSSNSPFPAVKCHREECQTAGHCKCKNNLTGGDDKVYKMIGECYIHGMMDGEALLHQQRNEISACTFRIG